MNNKEFKELVMARYSCRDFNEEKVSDLDIEKIIELARFSPSACNSQPWQLIYTTEEEKLEKITKCLQDNNHNLFLSKAKGYIALVETEAELKESISGRFSSTHFVKYDIGEMIAYITLTAKSMGIDTCIIGWINEEINNVLG
ncbi:MAG: nitroreductase family protein, partial [Firmicutes bacterium]|nr:nitroreductase family protein [Candidatus Caballimonas caccae]